jgi:hypothetical protein
MFDVKATNKVTGTVHDTVAPVPDRVHNPLSVPPDGTPMPKVIWPVGAVAPLVEVSVTVVVQVLITPARTGFGLHATVVVVGLSAAVVTVTATDGLVLAAYLVSPL